MNKRELKYRAWDKLGNSMSPSFTLLGEFTLCGGIHDWQFEISGRERKDFLAAIADLELMQYTGLTDKKGKEIFEGDIVVTKYGHIRRVVFHNGSFRFVKSNDQLNKRKKVLHPQRIFQLEITVIGNIYTNPELFGTNKKSA